MLKRKENSDIAEQLEYRVRNMLVRIQRVEKVGEGDGKVELAQAKWRTLDILVLPHSIIFSDRDGVEGGDGGDGGGGGRDEVYISGESYIQHGRVDNLLWVQAIPKINTRRVYIHVSVEGERMDIDNIYNSLSRFRKPCRKPLLVFINPFSGTRRGLEKWKTVAGIVSGSGLEYKEIITEKRNHARDLIQNMDLDLYSGVVTVSGDGLIHEVLNGLSMRGDWDERRRKFPIGFVPGGSGNAINCSLLYQQDENFHDEILVSSLNLSRGVSKPGDYLECETEERSFLSMFGVAWGLLPDCDLGSEVIRWAGFLRVYIWFFFRILNPTYYRGYVHYLPLQPDTDKPSPLPDIHQPVPKHWTSIQGDFLTVYALRQGWLDYSTQILEGARIDDGIIHLVIVPVVSRVELLKWLLGLEIHKDTNQGLVTIIPVSAFRFEMENINDPLTVDAERLTCKRVQGRIIPSGLRILVKEDIQGNQENQEKKEKKENQENQDNQENIENLK